MGKTERRLPRGRARSGREPLGQRGHASTGSSIARSARCAASASTVVTAISARSVVGDQSASTVVSALSARSVVGVESASTVVTAIHARSAVGRESASTVVGALHARNAAGDRYASTVVGATDARSAVGHKSASTVVSALIARSAVGVESASTVVSAIIARSARSSERRLTHSRSRYDKQPTVRVVVTNRTPTTEIESHQITKQTRDDTECQSNFDEFQSRLPAEERYFRSCTDPPFTHTRSD